MTQATLESDGRTYDPALDGERLGRQLDRVRDVLLSHRGTFYTLAELQSIAGGSEAGVSARIRDLTAAEAEGRWFRFEEDGRKIMVPYRALIFLREVKNT